MRALDPACPLPLSGCSWSCLYRKLDSTVVVMKSAEDRHRCDAADVLDGAMDRSVFAKRNGEANRARKRQNRATIAADVRRLAHVINTDGVLATHSPPCEQGVGPLLSCRQLISNGGAYR